jgi:hypothetical protein
VLPTQLNIKATSSLKVTYKNDEETPGTQYLGGGNRFAVGCYVLELTP